MVVLLAAACGGGSDATDAEHQVCASLQGMTDALLAGEHAEALAELGRLDDHAARSGSPTMQEAGETLFDAIGRTVDYGELTVAESVALGEQVLADGATGIDGLADECNRLGEPIEAQVTGTDVQR